jgi:very-short-patch-repair endonuclease
MCNECQFCDKSFKTPGGLGTHVTSSHKDIRTEDYYLKFINPNQDGKCKFCGKEAQFKGLSRGFLNICKSPVCVKKSFSPFSKEYKMKIDGLSESQYEEWSEKDSARKREITTKSFREKRTQDPDFDRKNSKYCKEFWMKKGHSEEESIRLSYNETQKNRDKFKSILKESPDFMKGKSWVSEKYWMNKGYTEEESKKIVSEKQSTFSLEKCIEKYGEKDGRKRWVDRQDKWNKNYKKTNYSKISQELFWNILEFSPEIKNMNPIFATFNKGQIDLSGINHEKTLKTENISVKPDFILDNKIIEFDGVYWHDHKRRNKPENMKRETIKDKELISSGYSILRINEIEYEKNKQETIEKCVKFLNAKYD